MNSSERMVLQLLFDYLDLKDQWKFLKIYGELRHSIEHGLLRMKCENLYIREGPYNTLLLQYSNNNKTSTKEFSPTRKEVDIILNGSSKYIKTLQLQHVGALKNILQFRYIHLRTLIFHGVIVNTTHIQQVIENCLNLQSFTLINCMQSKWQALQIGRVIDAEIFGKIQNLNELNITSNGINNWNYRGIQQLFTLTHLKTVNFNILCVNDSYAAKRPNNSSINDCQSSESCFNHNNNNNVASKELVFSIENLTLGKFRDEQSWSIFVMQDLPSFRNLTKLALTMDLPSVISINDYVLAKINVACPKLLELSLTKCQLAFIEFPQMKNLIHLTLRWCLGLRIANLEEIFLKVNLKSITLTAIDTCTLYNSYDYTYTSLTLETIILDTLDDPDIVEEFCYSQHHLPNVFTFKILNVTRLPTFKLHFSYNFPNLQELQMDSFYLSMEDILLLKHLKILKFSLFNKMSWSYLETLFQHPKLSHITIGIQSFGYQYFEGDYDTVPNTASEGLTTTLEYLCLPSTIFEKALNFWPCFQQRNKMLKLKVIN